MGGIYEGEVMSMELSDEEVEALKWVKDGEGRAFLSELVQDQKKVLYRLLDWGLVAIEKNTCSLSSDGERVFMGVVPPEPSKTTPCPKSENWDGVDFNLGPQPSNGPKLVCIQGGLADPPAQANEADSTENLLRVCHSLMHNIQEGNAESIATVMKFKDGTVQVLATAPGNPIEILGMLEFGKALVAKRIP